MTTVQQPEIDSLTLAQSRERQAKKVTWVGFFVNMILSVAKIVAGILGRSSAMVADGIHSFSDFVTDVVVIAFIGVSSKAKDEDHSYGHGKYETFATLLVSGALLVVAAILFIQGVQKVLTSLHGEVLEQPTYLALAAAIVSIICKEWLFRYTRNVGVKIKSDVVVANAWHHRSDAFSSIGTLLGISGAMFLGEKWRILDPIACLIVSVFVCIAGVKIMIPAIRELLDHALPPEVEKEITETVMGVEGVENMHNLKTRKNGNSYIIEVHIMVNKDITITAGHNIATEVERELRGRFPGTTVMTSIHVEPDDDPEDDN